MSISEEIQRVLAGVDDESILQRKGRRPRTRFPKPPKLRQVVSISCSHPPDVFFDLLKKEGVTALVDLRPFRDYDRAGWADGRGIAHTTMLNSVNYAWLENLVPTKKMMDDFAKTFLVKRLPERDMFAWTRFLEAYQDLWKDRRPLSGGMFRDLIYGPYEAIAVTCRCVHHLDCHRALAAGIITKTIPGVKLKVLYPEDATMSRATPNRYLFHDFPFAGLTADVPIGVKANHERWLRNRSARQQPGAQDQPPARSGR